MGEMREIKFRAWDSIGKKMWDDVESHKQQNFKVNQEKQQWFIMQFTGFKDKNGKEIYEGDIVNTDNSDGAVSIFWDDVWRLKGYVKIECHKDCNYHGFDKVDGGFAYTYGQAIYTDDGKEIEVIGNIYEDGGLIK